MIIKIVLSILIIIASTSIGYLYSYKHNQHSRQLKKLYTSFQLLETEMMYSSSSLPYALNKIGMKNKYALKNLFVDTAELLSNKCGYSLEEAWIYSINKNFHKTCLSEKDKEILISFIRNLGYTDKEHQKKFFQSLYLELEQQQKFADDFYQKNGRLYKNLGLLTGLTIVIVFI
ncbi:stage III sporulation protein AB [Lutibacter sp. B2]|nr:stage III sporulation protein AB [Lutibacter sp. B2]